jgi:hypothetical protein
MIKAILVPASGSDTDAVVFEMALRPTNALTVFFPAGSVECAFCADPW